MKRRLPMTNQGESVLAAINVPPLTAETNRQAPTASQPGSDMAASQAAAIVASAHAPRSATGAIVVPARSTANAAKATAVQGALNRKRRHQPRAVV
jgi:hypothetical protein